MAAREHISAIESVAHLESTARVARDLPRPRPAETHAPSHRAAREYTATVGDSWWTIASRVSPSSAPSDVLRALHALQLLNPHLTDLTPGTTLRLPELSLPER